MLLLVSFAASCLHFSRKHLENKTAVLETLQSRPFLSCFHLFTVSFLFHYRFRPHRFLLVFRLNEHRCFRKYCWPPLPPHRLGSISLIFFSVPLIKGITLSLSRSHFLSVSGILISIDPCGQTLPFLWPLSVSAPHLNISRIMEYIWSLSHLSERCIRWRSRGLLKSLFSCCTDKFSEELWHKLFFKSHFCHSGCDVTSRPPWLVTFDPYP